MNAADKLRNSLANSSLFDRQKVLASVTNGIRNNGDCEIIVPYNPPAQVVYGDSHIECDYNHLSAIKEFLRQEGFSMRTAYHPVSCRAYGYIVSL